MTWPNAKYLFYERINCSYLTLRDSPMTLLQKLSTLEIEAEQFGFKWDNTSQIMAQIESECAEVEEHLRDKNRVPLKLQEEIGDLLHAVFSLCVFCKLDPEQTLAQSILKFEKRLTAVKKIANEQGLTSLNDLHFDELMQVWKKAKEHVG